MVDPLLISATAESASLNNLDPPRSIFGARELGFSVDIQRSCLVVDSFALNGPATLGANGLTVVIVHNAATCSRVRLVASTLRENADDVTRRDAIFYSRHAVSPTVLSCKRKSLDGIGARQLSC